jgi:hypothetical protein
VLAYQNQYKEFIPIRRYEKFMKRIFIILCLAAMLLLPAGFAANPSDTVSSGDAIYQVHVTSLTTDPAVFFPYEQGTVSVELSNSGNQSVSLSDPTILGSSVKVLNGETYNTVVHLGPGTKMIYNFQIEMDTPDGTYFPLFTVATKQSGSISYPFKVEVNSKNLSASIVDKPDNFTPGKKDNVTLSVVNPRSGDLTNIMITPSGPGVDVVPSQKFISSLSAGSSQEISFQITPDHEADLTFHITYQNGDNDHETDLVLPLIMGEDKKAAVPVINNVEVTSLGNSYKLTGDVNNAGITDAQAMTLTVDSPARLSRTGSTRSGLLHPMTSRASPSPSPAAISERCRSGFSGRTRTAIPTRL